MHVSNMCVSTVQGWFRVWHSIFLKQDPQDKVIDLILNQRSTWDSHPNYRREMGLVMNLKEKLWRCTQPSQRDWRGSADASREPWMMNRVLVPPNGGDLVREMGNPAKISGNSRLVKYYEPFGQRTFFFVKNYWTLTFLNVRFSFTVSFGRMVNIVTMMLHVIWACNCTFITRKLEKTYYRIA